MGREKASQKKRKEKGTRLDAEEVTATATVLVPATDAVVATAVLPTMTAGEVTAVDPTMVVPDVPSTVLVVPTGIAVPAETVAGSCTMTKKTNAS